MEGGEPSMEGVADLRRRRLRTFDVEGCGPSMWTAEDSMWKAEDSIWKAENSIWKTKDSM
jgi:hypothetical protein